MSILLNEQAPWQPNSTEGWSLVQLKRPFAIELGKMLRPEPLGADDMEVPYLKSQHVQWEGVRLEDLPTMWASPNEVDALRLDIGDLLVCEGGDVGRAALIDVNPPENCIIQNALHRVRGRGEASVAFLRYLLIHATNQEWFDVLCNRSTIAHFTVEKFGEMWAWLPPLHQQQQLAALLDRETTRLDALVAAKQEQLELIAEKRRALITRAVTQGLDADAPRRATGLPWLGEVPAHWEVVRLKMVSHSLQTGPFGSQLHAEEYIDGGIPVINPAHMRDGKIIPDDQITVSEETSERLAVHRLAVGDLVFARRGELGRCSVVSEAEVGWLCGTGSLRARLDTKRISPTYLQLYVEFTGVPDWLSTQSVGSTMDNLNTEILGDLGICLPSLREQKLILVYVTAETKKIAELQEITESSLALMHERRAALIAAAVTGKIELTTA